MDENHPPTPDIAPAVRDPARQVTSVELLQGSKELVIEHGGHFYRLLVTKNDKLILQK